MLLEFDAVEVFARSNGVFTAGTIGQVFFGWFELEFSAYRGHVDMHHDIMCLNM